MNRSQIEKLMSVYRDGLLKGTVPFWFPASVDLERGGFFTCLDRTGMVVDDDKAVWQQGRAAWLLGKLFSEVEPREEWLKWCEEGIRFLDRACIDPSDGRFWFLVSRNGVPLRKRRYAYSEAFAALAYGAYARAKADEEAAAKAERCLQCFIDHNLSPPEGAGKWTEARPMQSLGFPMITLIACQELRTSIGLAWADEWIDRSIERIETCFVKREERAVMEVVGPGGEIYDHFDGRTLNPGHALEASWAILREGSRRSDSRLVGLGCDILDWMWERGWDRRHGGVLYFVDLKGKPVQEYWHDMKFWWPQTETLIATLLAYQVTRDERYGEMHRQIHDWAFSRFPDPEYGEWFGYLHRDGSLSSTLKGNHWKGPFHLPRMQLFCWRICERLLESDHCEAL